MFAASIASVIAPSSLNVIRERAHVSEILFQRGEKWRIFISDSYFIQIIKDMYVCVEKNI